MILIGVSLGSGGVPANIAVVRKRFKHLKHHYEVLDRIRCPGETAAAMLPDILRNPSLPKLKRIYSQDRRPRKTVKERPWLLFHSAHTQPDIIGSLQHPDMTFKRIRIKTGLYVEVGHEGDFPDYTVEMAELVDRLATVVTEERLDLLDDGPDSAALRRELNTWHTTAAKPLDGRLISLALPVWFREAIPYRRAYRSV